MEERNFKKIESMPGQKWSLKVSGQLELCPQTVNHTKDQSFHDLPCHKGLRPNISMVVFVLQTNSPLKPKGVVLI
jgi:hypothetical protein